MRLRPPINTLSRRTLLILASASLGACSFADTPQDEPDQSAEAGDASSASGDLCWTALSPLPFAVQEIYPIAHRQRIHLAGGLLGRNGSVIGVSDRHVAYDPSTGDSESLGALPAPRHHPQLVSAGGRLFCLGGFRTNEGAVNWMMTGETLLYNDETGGWTPLANAPEAHAESVAAAIDNRIHIVGGRRNTGADNMGYGDHTDSNSHLVFDPASNAWKTAAPAPTARNSASGALINNQWHVAGGRTLKGGPMDTHEVYDPAEDRWRAAAPLPQGIGAGGNAAGAIGGKLYVFGGEYRGGVHPEVCRYDPAADAWEIVGEMATPRHGLGGVTMGRAIYAIGGAIRPSGDGTTDTVEAMQLKCP